MARYPEEIVITEEEQKERLKSINAATCECMLVAYIEGELVGHAGIQRIKNHIKYLHRGYLGISIQKKAFRAWNTNDRGTIILCKTNGI